MRAIKRLIYINLMLLILIYIIPEPKMTENLISSEIDSVFYSSIQSDIVEVSSRNLEEPRTIEESIIETVETIENVTKNTYIDVNSDLTVISNLTAEEFDKMLENTELYGIGQALEEAEKESGVNGLYLMGLACLESSYGKSNYARKRNNLVGWNAIDSNPDQASYFDSKYQCIKFVAEKLKNNYLTESGCYYNGKSAKSVDKKYCTDKKHADKIIKIINERLEKIK